MAAVQQQEQEADEQRLYEKDINECTHGFQSELCGYWVKMAMIQWAKHYPVRPIDADIKDARQYLKIQAWHFGCPPCVEHMQNYMKEHKPDLRSRSSLLWWLHAFFNAINRRVGVPELSRSEFMRIHIHMPPTMENMFREYQAWQRQKAEFQAPRHTGPLDVPSLAVAAAALTAGAGCWLWSQIQQQQQHHETST